MTKVERPLLNQLIIRAVERIIRERWEEFQSTPEKLRQEIENNLQRLIKRELQTLPLVIFLLQTTESGSAQNRTYHRRRPTAAASIAS